MVSQAIAPIAFVREGTGEILDSPLADALHRTLAAELIDVSQRQPLPRKAALKVAQKRVAALATGLLEMAAAALESEWEQQKIEFSD